MAMAPDDPKFEQAAAFFVEVLVADVTVELFVPEGEDVVVFKETAGLSVGAGVTWLVAAVVV